MQLKGLPSEARWWACAQRLFHRRCSTYVVLPMQAVGTASALSMNWICCVRNRCLCMLAATWKYAVRTTSGPYALLQCMLRAQRHAVIIILALVRSPAKYACLQFKLT